MEITSVLPARTRLTARSSNMWKDVMMMKRISFAVSVILAVMIVVMASADTAEGRHGRGGLYLSNVGFSISFGSPAVYASHDGHYPYRRHYRRPGYYRRGYGGSSLFFSFGSGRPYGSYGRDRYYGRRYGYYPRYRYRGYDRGHDYYPDRGRRVWIPGRNHDGRYRSGYWEYRDHDRGRDDHRGRGRGRGRGRY